MVLKIWPYRKIQNIIKVWLWNPPTTVLVVAPLDLRLIMRMRWLMVTTVRLGILRQVSARLIEDWARMPKIVNKLFTTWKSIITFYLPPTLPLSDADDTAHGEPRRAWPLGSSDDLEDDDVDDVEDVEDLLWHLDELCERLDSVPSSRESKTGLVGKSILPSPLSENFEKI